MSVFAEVLENCLEESGFSQKMVADLCGCSRAMIYSVLHQKKQLSEKTFQTMMHEVPLTEAQKKRLRVAYYSDIYTSGIVVKIDTINRRLSTKPVASISTALFAQYVPAETDTVIVSTHQLLSEMYALTLKLAQTKPNSAVITNYPFSAKELDDTVYELLSNNPGKIDFRHIVRRENTRKADNNISTFFDCVRYMRLHYSPYLYESVLCENESADVLFRYFYISDSFLFLFNTDSSGGILILSQQLITAAMTKVQMMLDECRSMTSFPKDYLSLKLLLARSNKLELQAAIDNYVCVGSFIDEELLDALALPSLPNRDILIKTAIHHYRSIKPSFKKFLTSQGFRRFAQTGRVQEFPESWTVPLPVKYRKKILQQYVEMFKAETQEVFILNDSLLSFAPGELFSVEIYDSELFLLGDCSNTDDKYLGEYVSFFQDDSIIAPFKTYLDFVLRNSLYYSREYSIHFLNDLIYECDNYLPTTD